MHTRAGSMVKCKGGKSIQGPFTLEELRALQLRTERPALLSLRLSETLFAGYQGCSQYPVELCLAASIGLACGQSMEDLHTFMDMGMVNISEAFEDFLEQKLPSQLKSSPFHNLACV